MSLSIRPNNYLIDLERELRSELLDVTKLEEEFWAMKAHILWLVEGDRSTSFFHTSALVRKRRNHILYMQDSMGNWLDGDREIADFIRKELWTLRDGIRLCILLKLAAVEIELDAKVAIELLTKDGDNPYSNNIIVVDCKEGLRKIPQFRIMHCYREANKCADTLARRGALLAQDFSIFMFPPDDVALLLSLDSVGTLYDRFVPSSLEAL
ncbi:hypothetical protein CFP56_044172 [Quercus suber]|uniref:RNase H type-1 domain-containing protein n=1 Tax=Quercus suber TaxID=58331 RepID=A0AAW0IQ23_QUESU